MSYRRSDSRHAARGIAERLRGRLGPSSVFVDVDSLAAGADFVEGVIDAIRESAVVVVLIGDGWLAARDDRGRRRLDDPDDNVRIEVEHALRWSKPVLPVLLDGAAMPRTDELPGSLAALPRLNAVTLQHVSWDGDVTAMIDAIVRMAGSRL